MSIGQLEGLAAVADRYALFIIDQWGVLHNGESLHDGAVETLRELRARGKKIVILSNSSKRLSVSTRRMAEMGIAPDCYDHCVTSGEEVWQALNARDEPFYTALGGRCMIFTWDDDRDIMQGLGLTEVDLPRHDGPPLRGTGWPGRIQGQAAYAGLPEMFCP